MRNVMSSRALPRFSFRNEAIFWFISCKEQKARKRSFAKRETADKYKHRQNNTPTETYDKIINKRGGFLPSKFTSNRIFVWDSENAMFQYTNCWQHFNLDAYFLLSPYRNMQVIFFITVKNSINLFFVVSINLINFKKIIRFNIKL